MTRVAVVVVLLCGGIAWVYWQGGSDTRQKARETKIKNEQEIRDAINDCADLHWSIRLQCDK